MGYQTASPALELSTQIGRFAELCRRGVGLKSIPFTLETADLEWGWRQPTQNQMVKHGGLDGCAQLREMLPTGPDFSTNARVTP